MASGPPIVKQVAWISVIPQLLVFGALVGIARLLEMPNYLLVAVITYLLLSQGIRRVVTWRQRGGMRLGRRKAYKEALAEFQKSYDFFTRHQWVDNWRYLVLLCSSRISYREMALTNMALCHGQLGNGKESKACYQMALDKFPDSEIARSALKMFESAESASTAPDLNS